MGGQLGAASPVHPLVPRLGEVRDKEANASTLGASPLFVSGGVGLHGGPAVDAWDGVAALGVGNAPQGEGPDDGEGEG
jgi:hypothetical protein